MLCFYSIDTAQILKTIRYANKCVMWNDHIEYSKLNYIKLLNYVMLIVLIWCLILLLLGKNGGIKFMIVLILLLMMILNLGIKYSELMTYKTKLLNKQDQTYLNNINISQLCVDDILFAKTIDLQKFINHKYDNSYNNVWEISSKSMIFNIIKIYMNNNNLNRQKSSINLEKYYLSYIYNNIIVFYNDNGYVSYDGELMCEMDYKNNSKTYILNNQYFYDKDGTYWLFNKQISTIPFKLNYNINFDKSNNSVVITNIQ